MASMKTTLLGLILLFLSTALQAQELPKGVEKMGAKFAKAKNDSIFIVQNSKQQYTVEEKAIIRWVGKNKGKTYTDKDIGRVHFQQLNSTSFLLEKIIALGHGPEQRKASHILVTYNGASRAGDQPRSKQQAEEIANQILQEVVTDTSQFANIAKEKSDGPSGPRGGDLGYFTPGMMVKPFNDAVFNGKVGDVVLVETIFGYHIVKVNGRKKGAAETMTVVPLIVYTNE
jgi:parvulin-like peptidyl-prolyl isomerase